MPVYPTETAKSVQNIYQNRLVYVETISLELRVRRLTLKLVKIDEPL